MKKLLVLALAAGLFVACNSNSESNVNQTSADTVGVSSNADTITSGATINTESTADTSHSNH